MLCVITGVPLLPNFSIVRKTGRCADGRVMTVQEVRGGHMRVCRPLLELCIPPWVMRASWDRDYWPHTRLRGRERLKFSFNV